LKKGKEYIFITNEGYTFKKFSKKNKKTLTLSAGNTFYESYDIALKDIVQIWRYVRTILPQDYKPYYLADLLTSRIWSTKRNAVSAIWKMEFLNSIHKKTSPKGS